ESSGAALWIHGHSHGFFDYHIGDTRVVCNSRGYPFVFPEGRISPDGTLQPFQPGIGMILMRRDLPVVPVYIKGTRDSLPPGRVWPRRSHVHVHFGEPCPVGDLKGDDAEQSPKAIAEALREKVARLEEPPAEESGG
ncbi:MAG: 1-acyl-sn-glycerol-3-phosphate acyltransferase, partial [Oceanipulchritudo sp.]